MEKISLQGVSSFKGEFSIPGDKSISHRGVILGSISRGITEIDNFLESEDCWRTVEIFRSLGVSIQVKGEGKLLIQGRGLRGLREYREILDAGNSGTTMRLGLGVLAGQHFTSTITGDNSLRRRPMGRVIKPLRDMGAEITAREDEYAPITIRGGELHSIYYHSPIASAQVKSAVLLAGLYAEGWTHVIEPAKSRDHTERMLKFFGASVEVSGLAVSVKGRGEKLEGRKLYIPGDISSAAFIIGLAAGLPNSEVLLKEVGINPTRSRILDVLKKMGADIQYYAQEGDDWEPRADIVVRGRGLRGVRVEKEDIPLLIDELPLLAVLGTQAEGETIIRDARELRVKETDRIKAMVVNLRRMGAEVEELEDGMIIKGGRKLRGAEVGSFGDHRTAMAMAIAGLMAEGETTVLDTSCIRTSFPEFLNFIKGLGSIHE